MYTPEGQNPLLDVFRLLAKPILIGTTILLPIPQHIRGPSLNHTLHQS